GRVTRVRDVAEQVLPAFDTQHVGEQEAEPLALDVHPTSSIVAAAGPAEDSPGARDTAPIGSTGWTGGWTRISGSRPSASSCGPIASTTSTTSTRCSRIRST